MPDEPQNDAPPETASPQPGENDDEGERLRALLRQAWPETAEPEVDVRSLVQRRLRERSRGKFYGEGWSTSLEPPVGRYLVTSLIMLAVAIGLYCLVGWVLP